MSQETENAILNPASTVNFSEAHFSAYDPMTAKEDWLLLNAKLMEDIGPKAWLHQLLDVLSMSSEEYDGHEIINPSLVIKVADIFKSEHELIIQRDQWIAANIKLIGELGVYKWLEKLLSVLESGNSEDL